MSAREWESSFLAVSALIGEPLEAVLSALGEPTTPDARDVERALRSPSREARAGAIARAVSWAALDVDAAGLA
jgi:hypothetical protein